MTGSCKGPIGNTQTNSKGFAMAARASDNDSWSLHDLSKLRVFDQLGQSLGDAGEKENFEEESLSTSLSFDQRLQLQESELQMLELGKNTQGKLGN